nr:hypothetical protein BaRGS_032871 [Batillaria attramentaria]
MPHNKSFAGLSQQSRTASTLTLSRWDWKTLFYNWSLPIDQIILGLRRGNLSNSNSNLSISSDGVESDDSSKPVKLRGNKVMRMGSFAYRATQFFENLGKKSNAKRKISNLSTPETDLNLRDGIQEESSLSSGSVGYLNIFSSFNKRRWGQRWCLVRENMFECYKTKTSHPCELNFLLKNCVLRQALAETNSPLAIMLLENNREKITVEPPTKDDLSQWLRVLMVETATEAVPEGLEEFFVDAEDQASDGQAVEAEYTDIMGASVIKSWEVGSAPAMSNPDKDSDAQEQSATTDTAENSETDVVSDQTPDEPVPERYLYTAVVKRPSASTLEEVFEEGNEEDEEQGHAEGGDGDEDGQKDEQEGAKKERVPRFTDNLAVYNANKNTTDSGFYSVKEANSDDSEKGRKYEGPEDNETISELRERIGRLREKLIQIKRKRIAVRDKRVRAFSAEERAVCDKEYLVLESECKETSATIQRLEEELKMAVEALGQS